MVACIFLFIIIMCMVIGANSSGCGIKCFSVTCKHNKGDKCRRKDITIYDNTVVGLCLNHTDDMNNRVIKPMKNAGFHKEHCVTVRFSAKAQEEIKDGRVSKEPKSFLYMDEETGMKSAIRNQEVKEAQYAEVSR